MDTLATPCLAPERKRRKECPEFEAQRLGNSAYLRREKTFRLGQDGEIKD